MRKKPKNEGASSLEVFPPTQRSTRSKMKTQFAHQGRAVSLTLPFDGVHRLHLHRVFIFFIFSETPRWENCLPYKTLRGSYPVAAPWLVRKAIYECDPVCARSESVYSNPSHFLVFSLSCFLTFSRSHFFTFSLFTFSPFDFLTFSLSRSHVLTSTFSLSHCSRFRSLFLTPSHTHFTRTLSHFRVSCSTTEVFFFC